MDFQSTVVGTKGSKQSAADLSRQKGLIHACKPRATALLLDVPHAASSTDQHLFGAC